MSIPVCAWPVHCNFLPTSRLYAASRKQLLVNIGLACLNRGDMVGVWVIDALIQHGGLTHA